MMRQYHTEFKDAKICSFVCVCALPPVTDTDTLWWQPHITSAQTSWQSLYKVI